jgi:hypothetical protein
VAGRRGQAMSLKRQGKEAKGDADSHREERETGPRAVVIRFHVPSLLLSTIPQSALQRVARR